MLDDMNPAVDCAQSDNVSGVTDLRNSDPAFFATLSQGGAKSRPASAANTETAPARKKGFLKGIFHAAGYMAAGAAATYAVKSAALATVGVSAPWAVPVAVIGTTSIITRIRDINEYNRANMNEYTPDYYRVRLVRDFFNFKKTEHTAGRYIGRAAFAGVFSFAGASLVQHSDQVRDFIRPLLDRTGLDEQAAALIGRTTETVKSTFATLISYVQGPAPAAENIPPIVAAAETLPSPAPPVSHAELPASLTLQEPRAFAEHEPLEMIAGRDLPKDEWLLPSTAAENTPAMAEPPAFNLADHLPPAGQRSDRLAKILALAESADPKTKGQAFKDLGSLFANGARGLAENDAVANQVYEMALAANPAQAQAAADLGYQYLHGNGAPADPNRALGYFERAAGAGRTLNRMIAEQVGYMRQAGLGDQVAVSRILQKVAP